MIKRLIKSFIFLTCTLCLVYLLPSLFPIRASETTFYLGSVERTFDDTGTLTSEKVYIPAGNATVVKTKDQRLTTNSQTNYLYADHLGSTVLVTDDQGVKETILQYYPYGNEYISNPQPVTRLPAQAGNSVTEKLYTGQRKDNSSDLYFYNARYYNPATGNFISADKASGPNRYSYVSNNPVMRNDPSGLMASADDGGGVGKKKPNFFQKLLSGYGQALSNKKEWDYYYAGGNSPKYGKAPVNFAALEAGGIMLAAGGIGLTPNIGSLGGALIGFGAKILSNPKVQTGLQILNFAQCAEGTITHDPMACGIPGAPPSSPINRIGSIEDDLLITSDKPAYAKKVADIIAEVKSSGVDLNDPVAAAEAIASATKKSLTYNQSYMLATMESACSSGHGACTQFTGIAGAAAKQLGIPNEFVRIAIQGSDIDHTIMGFRTTQTNGSNIYFYLNTTPTFPETPSIAQPWNILNWSGLKNIADIFSR